MVVNCSMHGEYRRKQSKRKWSVLKSEPSRISSFSLAWCFFFQGPKDHLSWALEVSLSWFWGWGYINSNLEVHFQILKTCDFHPDFLRNPAPAPRYAICSSICFVKIAAQGKSWQHEKFDPGRCRGSFGMCWDAWRKKLPTENEHFYLKITAF